jgi:hypothetical protein
MASKVVATVPDLIAVIDAQDGSALGTPDYKYGLRVVVIGVTASPRWTDTPRGLEIGDLRAFGCVLDIVNFCAHSDRRDSYDDIPYEPLGVYVKPRSVIEEYGGV